MEIVNLTLPATNRFATNYFTQTKDIQPFFHYNYQERTHYEERLQELAERSFMRNELADHISEFMNAYPTSLKIGESLEKLRKENSVVVIGGQQAGILTGPLYSIHKVISIIAFAKEKEKELGVPVVPLFWIAGEDHDYAEVNHVYVQSGDQLEKKVYPEKVRDKRMVSDVLLDRDICLEWVKDIIETFGETDYTNDLLTLTENALKHSRTYVDFFAYTIAALFKEHGLLLVDSGNQPFRHLQKKFFVRQIHEVKQITAAVKKQQAEILKQGYEQTIEIAANAANLFFYDKESFERMLLEYDPTTKRFSGKNGAISFTEEELLHIAKEYPEKLSNNVVTRPIMQESMFPTLAFIAGPGEIAYWAELKQAFEALKMKMPPIVPRINITLLERDVEATLSELQLDLQEILQSGISKQRDTFLEMMKDKSIEALFLEMKAGLQEKYELFTQKSESDYRGLLPLIKKNEAILLKQLSFLEGKFAEALHLKHDVQLKKYGRIESSLRPAGGPQERTWNIFYFLNKYGLDFAEKLTSLPFEFDGKHKVVKL